MSQQIKARVQCVVDIPVGTWSGGKEVDTLALTEQIRNEGRSILISMLKEKGGVVIGHPTVSIIFVDNL